MMIYALSTILHNSQLWREGKGENDPLERFS